MRTTVSYLNGTMRNSRSKGYISWREWWESLNGRFKNCACVDCSNKAEVGGLVMPVYGFPEWYVIPLCRDCNRKRENDKFDVWQEDMQAVNS